MSHLQNNHGNTLQIVACQKNDRDRPHTTALRDCPSSIVKYVVEHGVTRVVDTKVSPVYTTLMLNKAEIAKYLIQKQNKTISGKYNENVYLFGGHQTC
jgi:hypothetical protein